MRASQAKKSDSEIGPTHTRDKEGGESKLAHGVMSNDFDGVAKFVGKAVLTGCEHAIRRACASAMPVHA